MVVPCPESLCQLTRTVCVHSSTQRNTQVDTTEMCAVELKFGCNQNCVLAMNNIPCTRPLGFCEIHMAMPRRNSS